MIPPFDSSGKLPPGIHWTSWAEVVVRFGTTRRRRRLLEGLRRAMDDLTAAGCSTIYIDGSFVTSRAEPGDFDACWDATGVNLERMEVELIAYAGDREDQRAGYGGELFPAGGLADPYGTTFLDLFQTDKHTRRPKGIVAVRLGG
jgi:hypothetical protein